MTRIAVTGAFGFVGSALVECLVENHEVLALSRSPRTHPKALCLQVDYCEATEMTRALEGVDVLVHLAQDADRQHARSKKSGDAEQAIVAAMESAGVKKLIFASSIYARLFEEGEASFYGRAKVQSERVFSAAPFQSIFLRFPAIYGPGCRGGFDLLVQAISRGLPLPFGAANAPRSYIARENAVSAIAALVNMDAVGWEALSAGAYEPSDMRALSTAELARTIGEEMRRPARLILVPSSAFQLLGRLTGRQTMIAGIFDSLLTQPIAEFSKYSGWFPETQIPESLKFLSET